MRHQLGSYSNKANKMAALGNPMGMAKQEKLEEISSYGNAFNVL